MPFLLVPSWILKFFGKKYLAFNNSGVSQIKRRSFMTDLLRNKKEYFTNSKQFSDSNLQNSFIELNNASVSNPQFCKKSCSHCEATCTYKLGEIHPKKDFLTKEHIKRELKRHNHPQSHIDKKTKKNRSLEDAKKELYLHYIINHKKTF